MTFGYIVASIYWLGQSRETSKQQVAAFSAQQGPELWLKNAAIPKA